MKYKFLLFLWMLASCTTRPTKVINHRDQMHLNTSDEALVQEKIYSMDEIIKTAKNFINNDDPQRALDLLNTLKPMQHTIQSKKIYAEAMQNLIIKLRFKVRALFMQSAGQHGVEKRSSLQQCEKILLQIIHTYPKYSDLDTVKNNLRQVQKELYYLR